MRLFVLALSASIVLVSSCRTGKPATTAARKAPGATATSWEQKRRQGVDFVASGNVVKSASAGRASGVVTPAAGAPAASAWSLDVDFAKKIQFRSADGNVVELAVPKAKPTGAGGVLLDAADRRNKLKVYIEPLACRDARTRRDYAYTVRVEAGNRRYEGCGAFIRANQRLQGTWALESFHGQRLRAEQFAERRLPTLEIDLNEKKLGGFTGYNPLKGGINADADQVKFNPDAARRRRCPTTFEDDFLTALRQSTLFRIGKNRLTLLQQGQYVMTLRKVN